MMYVKRTFLSLASPFRTGFCNKKSPASNDRGLHGSGRIGRYVRVVCNSESEEDFHPVSQGSYAPYCVVAIARGRSPSACSAPIWLGLPGGRGIPHCGKFPGQSKVWSKYNLLLIDRL